MDSKPINGQNAIESTSFLIQFSRPLKPNELDKAKALMSTGALALEFPRIQSVLNTQVETPNDKLEGGRATFSVSGFNAISLKDGKTSWTVSLADNRMSVTCHAYTRWDDIWRRSSDYLRQVAAVIDSSDLFVNLVALQVIDKFVGPETLSTVSIKEDVFASGSPYLTGKSRAVGNQWHVHQGWFETENVQPTRPPVLSVLNLSRVIANAQIITIIDHVLQHPIVVPLTPAGALQSLNNEKSHAEVVLTDLHSRNKSVLIELLSKAQLVTIGLSDEVRTVEK